MLTQDDYIGLHRLLYDAVNRDMISGNGFVVGSYILDYFYPENNEDRIGVKRIGDIFGINRRTVTRQLAALSEINFLKFKTYKKGRAQKEIKLFSLNHVCQSGNLTQYHTDKQRTGEGHGWDTPLFQDLIPVAISNTSEGSGLDKVRTRDGQTSDSYTHTHTNTHTHKERQTLTKSLSKKQKERKEKDSVLFDSQNWTHVLAIKIIERMNDLNSEYDLPKFESVKGENLTQASKLILTRIKQVQKQVGQFTDLSKSDTEAFFMRMLEIKASDKFWTSKGNLNPKTVFQWKSNWEAYSISTLHNWTIPSLAVKKSDDEISEDDLKW